MMFLAKNWLHEYSRPRQRVSGTRTYLDAQTVQPHDQYVGGGHTFHGCRILVSEFPLQASI